MVLARARRSAGPPAAATGLGRLRRGWGSPPRRLTRQWMGGDQRLEPLQVHGARIERVVEAAPAALAARHPAQMGRCLDAGGCQQGVQEFTEGVAATPTQRVHLLAEGSELFPLWCVHIQKDALS